MARRLCPSCNGAGGTYKEVKSYEPCSRCNSAGGKNSGRVWVPCSSCGGKGGTSRTTTVIEDCRTCGGAKFVGG
jgi:DnaJ-class molecular chaperone